MTIETARRIKWRLQELDRHTITLTEVTEAIYLEAGLDRRTVKKYIKRLAELGMIKRLNRYQFKLH